MGFADSVDGAHLLLPEIVDVGEYAVALATHALMAALGVLMGERGHRVRGEAMLLAICAMTLQLLRPRSPHGLALGLFFLDGLSAHRIALRDLGLGHRSE